MVSNRLRRWGIVCAATALLSFASDIAHAQGPGAPQVTVQLDNSVVITYAAPSIPPATTSIVATFNGAPLGTFPIGSATTVASGTPLAAGAYTVQVVWGPTIASAVTSFTVPTVPAGAITLNPPVVTGNTVALSWTSVAGATGYELHFVIHGTSQTNILAVGNQTSITGSNVPPGNYLVRVRARTTTGVGPLSNQVLVSVGTTFRVRDMEVTLTWNTLSDLDLHVIEPDGTHVFWNAPRGKTAVLDTDNTSGFGPETISVGQNAAATGVYEVLIGHYRGLAPSNASIAITLNVGTPNAKTEVFTRKTSEPDASALFGVALVDIKSGVISETFSIRKADEWTIRSGMLDKDR